MAGGGWPVVWWWWAFVVREEMVGGRQRVRDTRHTVTSVRRQVPILSGVSFLQHVCASGSTYLSFFG